MLQPNRRKYRKDQKGRNYGLATRGANVSFGQFGLKTLERGRLTARQIEAARRAITRHIKRGGRVWIRVFPDKPISEKPAEVRMGNGKGNPEYRAVCFMKWTGLTNNWLAKLSLSQLPSCLSKPRLLSAKSACKERRQ
jgi:ribosomal protein L16